MRPFPFCALVLATTLPAVAADDYPPGPDSLAQPGVPKGEVTQYSFNQSKIFPGTIRDYWVYVPKQYDPAKPTPVMIFQDGVMYNAPATFDNLIHKKEIPVLIGIFVSPGRVKSPSTNALDRFNRSYEYDGLGDNYARFLLEELLPYIAREQQLNLSTDPNDRAIAGASSGGICAFTAAWERPDAFRRVFTSVGTFVGLRGGNSYPILVRKTEPKPIRIFLQDGSSDLNIYGGNWYIANQDMLSALEFSGYDVNHVWGEGGHNGKHATAVFPEALRWLWRDYPAPIKANPDSKSRQPVMEILSPGEDWQVVGEGSGLGGLAVNSKGEVFFTDARKSQINRVAVDGQVSVFKSESGNAYGLAVGPDDRLYASQVVQKRIVTYDADGREAIVAADSLALDLTVANNGNLYFTDGVDRKVYLVDAQRKKSVVDEGIDFPNGVRLSPDQTLLYVSDTRGQFVYSFQVQTDGTLAFKQRFFHLHLADGSIQYVAGGLTVDTAGRLYVLTDLGVQYCDQAGRVNGIILKPVNKSFASAAFGGPNFDTLCVICGDKVFKRKTKATGVHSWQKPMKPAAPRL